MDGSGKMYRTLYRCADLSYRDVFRFCATRKLATVSNMCRSLLTADNRVWLAKKLLCSRSWQQSPRGTRDFSCGLCYASCLAHSRGSDGRILQSIPWRGHLQIRGVLSVQSGSPTDKVQSVGARFLNCTAGTVSATRLHRYAYLFEGSGSNPYISRRCGKVYVRTCYDTAGQFPHSADSSAGA